MIIYIFLNGNTYVGLINIYMILKNSKNKYTLKLFLGISKNV